MNTIDNDDVRLAIVGCGSVGSVLSMLLEKSGCGRFTLIDPEELSEDNVARHLCGCRAVATTPKKVEAVKIALESHLPSVDCRVYDRDILDVLTSTPQVVDDADLVIVATGNMAVERRINDVFVGDVRKPVIYLWIEPYGVAGHILYISPDHGGCYRCCFADDGQFLFLLAQDGHLFARREAGCQQTFTPYGVADLTMFCAAACKEIIRIIKESQNQSTLITWVGDLEQFQSTGRAIRDEYRAHTSYSIHRREISKRDTCVSCGNRG